MGHENIVSTEVLGDILLVNRKILKELCETIVLGCSAKGACISLFIKGQEKIFISCGTISEKVELFNNPLLVPLKDGKSSFLFVSGAEVREQLSEHPGIQSSDSITFYAVHKLVYSNTVIGIVSVYGSGEPSKVSMFEKYLQKNAHIISEFIDMRYYIRNASSELSEVLYENQTYDSVIKSMNEGVVAVDMTGKFMLYNKAAEEYLGVGDINVKPEKWSEFYQCYYHENDLPIPSEELPLYRAMTEGKNFYNEFYIVNKASRRKISLSVNASPIFDKNTKKLVGGVALFSDITELKKERNLLHQVFDHAVDAMIMINTNKEIIFFNKAAEDMFGHKGEDVFGQNVKVIIPEPYKSKHDSYVDRHIETGQNRLIGIGTELEMERKDGSRFWGHIALGKAETEAGVLYTAFIKDISEQVFLRNSLREKHNELLALVETAPVALAMVDNDMRYLAASQKWLEDYGIVDKQILGKSHYEIFPEITQEWKDIHKKALGGEIVSREVDPFYRIDGSVQWLKWVVRPWTKEDGDIGGLVMLTEEISKRMEVEFKLREAKETAEKISKEKDMFLSNMSHEIRTPLNAINGIANILYSANPRQDQKEYVETLKVSSNNLVLVINDILDYAKLGTGDLSLLNNTFRLKTLVYDVVKIQEVEAVEKRIQLNVNYDSRIPQFVEGDNLRISQVLNNLLGNAVKFTNEGGVELIVELLEKEDKDVIVSFKVKDTGIGIHEKDYERIFQQFQQADSSSTRRFGGTGLGLSISQSIVKMMGGEINVDSEPGNGSVFSFHLKLHESDSREETQKAVGYTNFSKFTNKKKVLLVEDNKANQLVASTFLKEWGLSCDVAENGLVAVKKVKEEPGKYALILMDLQMPVMDGYEASEKINEITENTIPIISLSASVNAISKQKAQKAGIRDSVSKPFEPVEFHTKLSHFLNLDNLSLKQESSSEDGLDDDIDISFFESIADGDEELKKELLEALRENVCEIKENYPIAILNNDSDQSSRQAHKIKGVITKIKKDDLWELIEEGKRLITENSTQEQKEDYIKRFEKTCDGLISKLDTFL